MSNTVINGTDNQSFFVTPKGITISASTKRYNTYADMKADHNPPNLAYVIDASEDPTVGSGGAFYRWTGTSWKKMYEEESMDQDINYDELVARMDVIESDIEAVHETAGTVQKYLLPTWIPVDRTEGLAKFDVDTRLGNYYAIRITDSDVETFGTVFDVNFISDIAGATYTNTIPLNRENAAIIVDVQVDSPSNNVQLRVDGVLYPAPNRLDVYWNGTKAVLDPKTKQINVLKNTIISLQEEIERIKTETANIETVFVNDGTDEHPAEVALSDDEWCVMTSPFVATLPENAKNGDSIHMSVEHGSAKMTVVAPNGVTINGSSMPCLVGVDGDGIPINNISFYFVFNAAQNNWIVL